MPGMGFIVGKVPSIQQTMVGCLKVFSANWRMVSLVVSVLYCTRAREAITSKGGKFWNIQIEYFLHCLSVLYVLLS